MIAAAHRQHHAAAGGHLVQGRALDLGQVQGAAGLVAVLASADVEQVGSGWVQRLAQARRTQCKGDTAPAAPALEQQQIAAVGVDVHQVGVKRAHAQLRHWPSLPRYPRSREWRQLWRGRPE